MNRYLSPCVSRNSGRQVPGLSDTCSDQHDKAKHYKWIKYNSMWFQYTFYTDIEWIVINPSRRGQWNSTQNRRKMNWILKMHFNVLRMTIIKKCSNVEQIRRNESITKWCNLNVNHECQYRVNRHQMNLLDVASFVYKSNTKQTYFSYCFWLMHVSLTVRQKLWTDSILSIKWIIFIIRFKQ